MLKDLDPMRLDEWVNLGREKDGFITFEGNNKGEITNLAPSTWHTLKIEAVAFGANPRLQVQAKTYQLKTGRKTFLTVKTRVETPVTVAVYGAENTQIKITPAREFNHEPVIPAEMVELDLAVPRASANLFILGKSRLSRAALTYYQIEPGTFILGTSRLGEGVIKPLPLAYWWRNVTNPTTSISTRRGIQWDGLNAGAEAGTLGAKIYNALDPRAIGAIWGTPLRCFHIPTRTPIFNGSVTSTKVTPAKDGTYTVNIYAADKVAELASIKRYGCVNKEPQTWQERAADLLDPHGIKWQPIPAITPRNIPMARTVYESTLLSHLDLLASTQRGTWWLNRAGVVCICPGNPKATPAYTLTDTHADDDTALNPWYYTQAAAGFDSVNLVTEVEVTNQAAKQDEQGKWQADETTYPGVINPTLAATYGTRTGQITVNTTSKENALFLAASAVNAQDPKTALTGCTVNALTKLAAALEVDVMTPVLTVIRGERATAYISSINHEITPYTWLTNLELLDRKE